MGRGLPGTATSRIRSVLWGARPGLAAGSTRRVLERCTGTACVAAACMVFLGGTAGASTGWRVEPVPKPPGAGSTILGPVSCPAKGNCTAVGSYHKNGAFTLAEHWNGASWAIQPTPNPPSGSNPSLNGVSCGSPANCIAVGDKNPSKTGGDQPLAEQWDGTRWTLLPISLPAGAADAYLEEVSCASPSDCTAVGWYDQASNLPNQPLAEHWNGTNWTAERVPLPPDANITFLEGVSCPATLNCVAVGSYGVLGQETGLFAERWNGSRWTVQVLPHPAGSAFLLNSVSCPSGRSCTAVGGSYNGSQQQASIVERWNGTSWALQADAAPAYTMLSGVSCPSATACTAVGTAWAGLGSKAAMVAEHWNGTTWTIQATPAPRKAKQTGFGGVSCLATLYCTAVSSYNPGNGDGVPYAEQEH